MVDEDEREQTTSSVDCSQNEHSRSREDYLLNEFKSRESTAFFAMFVVGIMLYSSPYFVYVLFLGIAIFGAFQLRFMDLVNTLAIENSSVESAHQSKTANKRDNFLRGVSSGVMGNMVWWLLLIIGMFLWQQFKLDSSELRTEIITQNDKVATEADNEIALQKEE